MGRIELANLSYSVVRSFCIRIWTFHHQRYFESLFGKCLLISGTNIQAKVPPFSASWWKLLISWEKLSAIDWVWNDEARLDGGADFFVTVSIAFAWVLSKLSSCYCCCGCSCSCLRRDWSSLNVTDNFRLLEGSFGCSVAIFVDCVDYCEFVGDCVATSSSLYNFSVALY